MYLIHQANDPQQVEERVCAIFGELFPSASVDFIHRIFGDVTDMFEGRTQDFQPNRLGYHDFTHTLQATDCLVRMMEGYALSNAGEPLTPRLFELGVASMMFHDTGYLITKSETSGTGAKYTYTHVLRSCSIAASNLPRHGLSLAEIDGVLAAIRCTGPTADITRLHFSGEMQRFLGCAVSSSDYLAQMAAADYPDELTVLFSEFEESDDYLAIPRSERIFKSAADLIAKTPAFWSKVVEPKLTNDLDKTYRFLARPGPDGENPYLDAIKRNLTRIREMSETPVNA